MTDFSALRGILTDHDIVALRNVEGLDNDQRGELGAAIRTAGAQLVPAGTSTATLTATATTQLAELTAAAELLSDSALQAAATTIGNTGVRPPSFAAMNARRRGGTIPRATPRRSVVASAMSAAGGSLDNPVAVAESFSRALRAADGAPGVVAEVLTSKWSDGWPSDRVLTGNDLDDLAVVEGTVSPAALVASGGICNPVNVDYAVPVFGDAARPLADGLPSFLATRGGLRFSTPPTLTTTAGATAVWTQAMDAGSPGNALTKAILTVGCPTETEVFVDAIPTRLRLGNMMGRFSPEWVAAVISTAGVAAARTAEQHLLGQISTYSTVVSSGQLLGATRDLLGTVDLASAAYRYRSRIPDTTVLRAVLPAWAKGMMRADLARQLATDNSTGDGGALAVTDQQLDDWLAVRGVKPIWMADGITVAQGFGVQSTNAVLLDWPHSLTWWLYAEGSFIRLDGGRLDLGVVRDSTLDASNNYEMFLEGFEAVAFRGTESLQVISSLRPNGESAATASTAAY